MLPNFVTIHKEVCEISDVENFCSRKSGLFTKIHQDLLRTNVPHCARFHPEKALQFFLHPSVFWRPRGTLCQNSLILALMYSKAPSINLLNFVPLWQPIYEISAAKLRWFRWNVTDRPTKTENDVSACMRRQKKQVTIPQYFSPSTADSNSDSKHDEVRTQCSHIATCSHILQWASILIYTLSVKENKPL